MFDKKILINYLFSCAKHKVLYFFFCFKFEFNIQKLKFRNNNTIRKSQILTFLFIIFEWIGKFHNNPLELIQNKFNRITRWFIYYAIIILIIYFAGAEQEFIYIQF